MKALIIEDNEAGRLILSHMLSKVSIRAKSCENVTQAKELMLDWLPKVIFLDLFLRKDPNGLDGIDFLESRKTDPRLSTVPVIVVSAISESEAITKCLRAGAYRPAGIIKII